MAVMSVAAPRLYYVAIMRLLVLGVLVALVVVFQFLALPSRTIHSLFDADKGSIALPLGVSIPETAVKDVYRFNFMPNVTHESDSEDDVDESGADLDHELDYEDAIHGFTQERPMFAHDGSVANARGRGNVYDVQLQANGNIQFSSQGVPSKGVKALDEKVGASYLLISARKSSNGNGNQSVETKPQNDKSQLLESPLYSLSNKTKTGASSLRSKLVWPISMMKMESLLLQSLNTSYMRPRWSSRLDRELFSAKLEIKNARAIPKSSGLYAPIFRDFSKFSMSYELMERKLKVYVYREGQKPIFHQPKMRGIYASEGWFMKLMEGNKRFIVRDPRKAHLFYLPFSSQNLRITLAKQNHNVKQMEQYLDRYVELIARRYSFWNRTGGADHFLVACHDWASRITREPMKNCIRSLCNANIAKGFHIGKDTTLPVTYIHSMMDPLRGFAGKPPSERSILAFFAGSMHGDLRPILLKHWENKEPDMKIVGPMPRHIEGKRIYMEYMNSSKYCICARGYEVHTPRIIEAIFSECIPVIISDNYVPPFFEVLNWEAFSVFVRERDIPILREILLSIPEEKYMALHLGVKKVQQHFQWHKVPIKYDLFHMILHAVWNNRLSQIRPR